jgi:transcription-repair coupling factor (superfamily II helicase)
VSTAIINRQEEILKVILERELARQGQVFWVYNRVQGLERVVEYVRKLAPRARIGMAHGQMNERSLEETMHQFWHGELDVLVCTAIIESGLDFPRANTLIVDQAQMFGLGQLYQLRGRVGRSDRQAYAIFVVSDVDRMNETARQRLRIILELDYLGAGFQVAMEDLRLRGAGNILGESQSGHMTRLGLDLFLEMLEEAVAKLKGEPLPDAAETEISLALPAHIPESYIPDARERLKYYKALSSATSSAAQRDIEFELRDRFGAWPDVLANFLAVLGCKRFLSGLGAVKADMRENGVRLSFDAKNMALDPDKLLVWATARPERVRLLPPSGLDIAFGDTAFTEGLSMLQSELGALRKTAKSPTQGEP